VQSWIHNSQGTINRGHITELGPSDSHRMTCEWHMVDCQTILWWLLTMRCGSWHILIVINDWFLVEGPFLWLSSCSFVSCALGRPGTGVVFCIQFCFSYKNWFLSNKVSTQYNVCTEYLCHFSSHRAFLLSCSSGPYFFPISRCLRFQWCMFLSSVSIYC